jgi:hypothetical protein
MRGAMVLWRRASNLIYEDYVDIFNKKLCPNLKSQVNISNDVI